MRNASVSLLRYEVSASCRHFSLTYAMTDIFAPIVRVIDASCTPVCRRTSHLFSHNEMDPPLLKNDVMLTCAKVTYGGLLETCKRRSPS